MRTDARSCKPSDVARVERLLADAGLPVPAPGDPAVEFVVVEDGAGIAACAGWETWGEQALLRSVAVREDVRRRGLGRIVVEAAVRELADRGVHDVTLVTLDAQVFFAGLGFESIEKGDVPEPIRRSPEFRIHDCAGGHWMRRLL